MYGEVWTLSKEEEVTLEEKKSQFIAKSFFISSVEEAREKLQIIRKEYADARHIVYAYVVEEGEVLLQKSSDDGEPSGTAGAPVLQALLYSELRNLMVVVIRYFGGILLGAGGLTRMYGKAAKTVLELSGRKNLMWYQFLQIELNYTDWNLFRYKMEKENFEIVSVIYLDRVRVEVKIPLKAWSTWENYVEEWKHKFLSLLRLKQERA